MQCYAWRRCRMSEKGTTCVKQNGEKSQSFARHLFPSLLYLWQRGRRWSIRAIADFMTSVRSTLWQQQYHMVPFIAVVFHLCLHSENCDRPLLLFRISTFVVEAYFFTMFGSFSRIPLGSVLLLKIVFVGSSETIWGKYTPLSYQNEYS